MLDCFGGAGSTLLAAQRVGRRARLVEIDPGYVDVTIRRWQRMTGKMAVNALTGMTFPELAALRAANLGENGASQTAAFPAQE